jgi:enoyl-CoA hydratase
MSVLVERNGAVTTVILSRSEARNAVDPATAEKLMDAFLAFDADPDQHVAVFWGAGGAFCAGFDLKAAATMQGRSGPLLAIDFPDDSKTVSGGPMGPTRLELSKPVIAALAGPAVAGGMELALWCDLRVMEETAYMGVYCRRWGVPLIDGGTVRRWPRAGPRSCAYRTQGGSRRVPAHRPVRAGRAAREEPAGSRSARPRAREVSAGVFARRSPIGAFAGRS